MTNGVAKSFFEDLKNMSFSGGIMNRVYEASRDVLDKRRTYRASVTPSLIILSAREEEIVQFPRPPAPYSIRVEVEFDYDPKMRMEDFQALMRNAFSRKRSSGDIATQMDRSLLDAYEKFLLG